MKASAKDLDSNFWLVEILSDRSEEIFFFLVLLHSPLYNIVSFSKTNHHDKEKLGKIHVKAWEPLLTGLIQQTEQRESQYTWSDKKKTKKNSANTSLSKPKRATTNNKTIIETRLFKDCKIVLFIHTDHLTYKQKDGEFLCRNSTTLNHPWKQYLIWLVNLNIEYKEKNYPQNSIPNMKRVPDFLAATFTL